MAKQGEIDYLKNIGEAGIRHAAGKPFTDGECGRYLAEVGAVLSLLPPPPARLLDVGCGTGWTSVFFAKRGYDVTGADIAPDMIACAEENARRDGLDNLHFVVSDYEDMAFGAEFDCAVFYDSLHHAIDESLALRKVFAALKPGGVCVTVEPGTGHGAAEASKNAAAQYGVTEKDMPPLRIVDVARAAGFTQFQVFPHAQDLMALAFGMHRRAPAADPFAPAEAAGPDAATAVGHLFAGARHSGIVLAVKPAAG